MDLPLTTPAPASEPGIAAPTGVKIVVNGRTVLHRHFLQEAMDAMVRRALADELPAPELHGAATSA